MSVEPDSFMSHLIELRDRLLRCVIALLLVFVCLFPWASDFYNFLAQPMLVEVERVAVVRLQLLDGGLVPGRRALQRDALKLGLSPRRKRTASKA